jgi:DNA-binding beta-propeller fold protein YncE
MNKFRPAILSIFTVAMLLVAGAVSAMHAASLSDDDDARVTTIVGLETITQVGSTASILDAQGNTVTVDPNPYKVAIAPENLGMNLREGDIVVSDIGNNDHGVTIARFPRQHGPAHLFNVDTPNEVLGPAGLTFDSGRLLVANSTGNNVLVFNPNGALSTTLTSPMFNGPWGITTRETAFENELQELFFFFQLRHRSGIQTFFTANKFDAKILRVDVIPQGNAAPKINVVEIAQFARNGMVTKIDLHWLPRLKVGTQTLIDVLLAIDPANNQISAIAHSSTLEAAGTPVTVFQGTPLNMPGGLTINPFNGDILVVNLMDNNLVELNATTGKVIGVKAIDPVVVDNQGNGSALFGVVATKDRKDNLLLFYTDDNTNTLNSLSVK